VSTCTTSLKIGLDARTVHRAVRRGTGKNLIDLYTKVLKLRPNWHVVGYHRGPVNDPIAQDGYTGRPIECLGDRFDAWRRWRLPAAAKADKVDLLHCPANLAPSRLPIPAMVTIHDLLPLSGPRKLARSMAATIRRCVARNTLIITPSQYTADALVNRFNANPQRIVVNHWAADQAMTYITDKNHLADVARRYGLHEPPVLHLGAPDPRKNTVNAIIAYAKLPAVVRKTAPLLVIGLDQTEHRRQIANLCDQLQISENVQLHGFADEADMPALFSLAQVLLYPSHSEGFGLPILDAWTARTAVLTANTTSLPEVGGNSVLYADPTDPDQIADGLRGLLCNSLFCQRLVHSGLQRIQQFTWTRTAERFIAAAELATNQTGGVYRDAA
jgi:glycosyltransferase involved in cell wall biosynthesis